MADGHWQRCSRLGHLRRPQHLDPMRNRGKACLQIRSVVFLKKLYQRGTNFPGAYGQHSDCERLGSRFDGFIQVARRDGVIKKPAFKSRRGKVYALTQHVMKEAVEQLHVGAARG